MNKLLPYIIFLCLSLGLNAQGIEPRVFDGINYYDIGGKWYLYDNAHQQFIPISEKILSLKLVAGISQSEIDSLEANEGISMVRLLETRWADFTLSPPDDILDKCENLLQDNRVERVEVSAAPQSLATPNDSLMATNPLNPGFPIQWSHDIANTIDAWDITTGDTNVVLAIVDNGIDWWVHDFQQASNTTNPFWVNTGEDAWADPNVPGGNGIDDDGNGYVDDRMGWNFVYNTNQVMDNWESPHGTAVASIATARTNNTEGMAGVAGGWGNQVGAKTMIVKVDDTATTPAMVGAAADDGILYAAQNGAHVINISMAFHSNINSISDAINLAYEKYNCLIVAASGNHPSNNLPVFFPANHPSVIGVAATNVNDVSASSHTGPLLDLSAPGISLPFINLAPYRNPTTKYTINSGTSFASPFVAGVGCLMYSINPCISSDEANLMLKHTADKVNAFDLSTNPGGYRYGIVDEKPGHFWEIGYGRVNAYEAVKTAQDHHSDSLDLYIKDHYLDFGFANSYPGHVRFDEWSEIWVRNQADGYANREMEEIEYQPGDTTAYVYVRIRNKSCVSSSGRDSLGLYWTRSSTGTSWPQNWDGSQPQIGNVIAETLIPSLGPGQDTIMEFEWHILGDSLQTWGTCIMARIESESDPSTYFPNDLAHEIRVNNNIAIRNLHVIRVGPGKTHPVIQGVEYPFGIQVYAGNVTTSSQPIALHFDIPEAQSGVGLAGDAELKIFMSDDFWEVYLSSGELNLVGLELLTDKVLLINEPHAKLEGLAFDPGQRESFFFGLNFLVDEVDSLFTYRYHITEYQGEDIMGAMNFRVDRDPRHPFSAYAGPDKIIHLGESTQLNAQDIHETASYQWYNGWGEPIGEGLSVNVQPEEKETFTLEVTADIDLYKAYDEVTVQVNPYFITELSPNPAGSTCNVGYQTQGAGQASLLVITASSGSPVLSQSLDPAQDAIALNTGSLSVGHYFVVLICDGQVADSQALQIQ